MKGFAELVLKLHRKNTFYAWIYSAWV